jgi:hypothetical protein
MSNFSRSTLRFCMVLGFPFVIHECPKQTPTDIVFHVHEIDAIVDRYVFLLAFLNAITK